MTKAILAVILVPALASAADRKPQKTVVLVHGAFADGSSWDKVIPLLEARGLKVVAVQNPLTSLADDAASVKRVIDAQSGPVILVGHSWSGTVITGVGGDDKVAALVFVAAFAPDVGESTADLGKNGPPPPGATSIRPDPAGYLYLTPEGVAKDFAQDLPATQTRVMAVTQGPTLRQGLRREGYESGLAEQALVVHRGGEGSDDPARPREGDGEEDQRQYHDAADEPRPDAVAAEGRRGGDPRRGGARHSSFEIALERTKPAAD